MKHVSQSSGHDGRRVWNSWRMRWCRPESEFCSSAEECSSLVRQPLGVPSSPTEREGWCHFPLSSSCFLCKLTATSSGIQGTCRLKSRARPVLACPHHLDAPWSGAASLARDPSMRTRLARLWQANKRMHDGNARSVGWYSACNLVTRCEIGWRLSATCA